MDSIRNFAASVRIDEDEAAVSAPAFCPRRVLVLTTDTALGDRLCEQIDESEEFVSLRAASLEEAAERLGRMTPVDLVLIDDALSCGDGPSSSRRLRSLGVRTPIILVAAADADLDTRVGLVGEADDALVKPVKTAALLARLRAHVCAAGERQPVLRLGPYEFRPDCRLLYAKESESVKLTSKEAALLLRLARANRKTVSRSMLLEQIWGYSRAVTTHTIETHVYRLRRKIRAAAAAIDLIETCRGGYRLRDV